MTQSWREASPSINVARRQAFLPAMLFLLYPFGMQAVMVYTIEPLAFFEHNIRIEWGFPGSLLFSFTVNEKRERPRTRMSDPIRQ